MIHVAAISHDVKVLISSDGCTLGFVAQLMATNRQSLADNVRTATAVCELSPTTHDRAQEGMMAIDYSLSEVHSRA